MREGSQNDRSSRAAKSAFQAIAPVYDDFTAHHDYELWLGNLLPELEAHDLVGQRLLDVGCGTGKSFIPMLKRGWDVTACDISPSMLELAKAKVGDKARLVVADMRELPKLGEFDLVLCLDDVINYLLDVQELERALAGMRRNLAPTGLLMFDANTVQAYRTFFAEESIVEKDGMRLLWQGRSTLDAEPGTINEASFEVEYLEKEGARPAVESHLHLQRHFLPGEVQEALDRVGLVCLDIVGHDHQAVPQRPVDEIKHTKAIYIARLS